MVQFCLDLFETISCSTVVVISVSNVESQLWTPLFSLEANVWSSGNVSYDINFQTSASTHISWTLVYQWHRHHLPNQSISMHITPQHHRNTQFLSEKEPDVTEEWYFLWFDIKVCFLGISDITATPGLISLPTGCLFDDRKYYSNRSHEVLPIEECYMTDRGIGSFIFGHIVETPCSHHVHCDSTA